MQTLASRQLRNKYSASFSQTSLGSWRLNVFCGIQWPYSTVSVPPGNNKECCIDAIICQLIGIAHADGHGNFLFFLYIQDSTFGFSTTFMENCILLPHSSVLFSVWKNLKAAANDCIKFYGRFLLC
jgi:hypothetical protein